MHPALEKRLERLHADLRREAGAALARREGLEARVAVGGNIRQMLVERGIDPAEIVALRQVDEAAAELAGIAGAGGRDAEAAADAGYSFGREAEGFIRELARLTLLHYTDGERPDGARSSLMEWHAWCLATPQSRHHPNILLDPEVVGYRQMLRLGGGDPRWRWRVAEPAETARRRRVPADGIHRGACGAIGDGTMRPVGWVERCETHPRIAERPGCRTTASRRGTAGTF